MFCHKMRRLQLGPEIHHTVLFLHEVLKQTRNIDTFGGDSFQNFFHTSTWNVINNFSYSTVEILWSDLVNTTIRCGELVNCKSLPVSSTARPACLGSKGTTKSNHVESIFSTTATSSSKMSSSLILKRLLGLAFWPALFKKKKLFSHWTVVCSQLAWRTDCYVRWIQFELLASCEAVRALANSTRNLESGNLFFLTKIWPSRIY